MRKQRNWRKLQDLKNKKNKFVKRLDKAHFILYIIKLIFISTS